MATPPAAPKKELSLAEDLREQANSFRDRASLKVWFEQDLNINEKKEVATWIKEVLEKLPKQEAPLKSAPAKVEKTTSSKLAAIADEDDLEPAEEGDAF